MDSTMAFRVTKIASYLIYYVAISSAVKYIEPISISRRDICLSKYPTHLYVVLGERSSLIAENNGDSELSECSVQLVTCSTCVIFIIFRHLDLPQDCHSRGKYNNTCPCDHVQISEQDKVSRAYFCNATVTSGNKDLSYHSQTRYLNIIFSYKKTHKHPFDIEYIAERNRQYLKGVPGESNITVGGLIKSPFFPNYYPRDLGVEYVVRCVSAGDHCRIKLSFTDFLVSPQSIMEFYDSTGQRLKLTNGVKPRPPIVISTGPSLIVRFLANGGSGLGYKGVYYFILGEPEESSLIPITDCGGEVQNIGGAITMMNMAQGQNYKYYDCVWLIKPIINYMNREMLLYTSVITFNNMGENSEILLYEGQTSEGKLLDIVKPCLSSPNTRVVSIQSGFYISLKATFTNTSQLAIVYSVFSNIDCNGAQFLCHNDRCISKQLYCDGFDHCGDNSDEPDTCSRDWKMEPVDRRWYTHTPNYYFPKTDNYLDLKTATLIFILSCIGLATLLTALLMLVYRMGIRTRQQRDLQERLQSISDLFEGAHISEMDANDDPPIYEPPPSYEEVMKREKEKIASRSNYSSLNAVTTVKLPDSPPPPYKDEIRAVTEEINAWAPFYDNIDGAGPSTGSNSKIIREISTAQRKPFDIRSFLGSVGCGLRDECDCAGACSCALTRRSNFSATWSPASSRMNAIDNLLQNIHSQNRNPESSDGKSCVKGSLSADNIFQSECI
ncbi:neuropilin and tolloid-like protein 1 isoform X3 [Halyomorpha halys]|uniref:neuropilin and tolloid-like protein 1 isoform X3 n=1 Tax=Halyomorpha halys TaxID=286706 RepID=UPI0034D31B44